MHTRAYWIFPESSILDVSSHHMAVIRSPEEFGETTQTIHDTYERYGERLGLEGKARSEILTRVIQRGFIRIRENRNVWM